jgi:hypothetical protein
MLMLEPRAITLDPSIVAFAHRLHGPRVLIGLRRSAHESFTDFVWVKPQLMRVAPAAARHIDVGSIGPRAVTEESAYLSAFFDRYLRRRREPLLLHASRAYPDVVPLRSGR